MAKLNNRDFRFARRVVVKVGTSLLRKSDNKVDMACLKDIAAQIAEIRRHPAASRQVVLVSSGAVGFGMMRLGLDRRPRDTATLQATAAVGQPELMNAWAECFAPHHIRVSQLLLTNDLIQDRDRFLNAKNALLKILDLSVIPIVNENDTVAVDELIIGDNDKLSALVATMIDADLLINLTDVDYVYDARGRPLKTISYTRQSKVSATLAAMAREARDRKQNAFTRGGMFAKVEAVMLALRPGIPVVIANGRNKKTILSILEGRALGTLFLPNPDGLKGKKAWLFLKETAGQVVVDRGAVAALIGSGKSLLPSGILRVNGQFPRGTCISVVSEEGREVAKGAAFYSADEISAIAGKPSSAIRHRLSLSKIEDAPSVVIHRDNLVVME